jgi:hypothetical protein
VVRRKKTIIRSSRLDHEADWNSWFPFASYCKTFNVTTLRHAESC